MRTALLAVATVVVMLMFALIFSAFMFAVQPGHGMILFAMWCYIVAWFKSW